MTKKTLSIIALMLALAMLLGACTQPPASTPNAPSTGSAATPGATESTGTVKDTLIVATNTDPGTMNPYDGMDKYTRRFAVNVVEQLFRLDESMTVQPELCESYEFDEDNLGITLHLRKGVKFHNGEEMTAEDVVYSFACMQNCANASALSYIDWDNIKAVDEYTVYVPTKTVAGTILYGLCDIFVVNKAFMEAEGKEAGQKMVGTGPFAFSEWVSGDHLTLTRFADYWGNAPAINKITYRVIVEASVAMIELETGGVDLVLDAPSSDVIATQEKGDASEIGLYVGTGLFNNFIGFNCEKAPLDNINVRKAIAHAIDCAALVEGACEGWGWVANGIVSSGAWAYNPDVPFVTYDVELAKKMLAEEGYESGFKLTLLANETSLRVAAAEQLVNMLAKVGIELKVEIYDFATYNDIITNTDNYDIYLRGVTYSADPGDQLIYNGASEGHKGGMNATRTGNIPEAQAFDALVNKALATVDDDARKDLYYEAQLLYQDNLWALHFQTNPESALFAKNLKGFWMVGSNACFKDIYFE